MRSWFCRFVLITMFVIEPRYWGSGPITNIVISQSYTGTVQVGSNFYHLQGVTNFYITKELVK